MEDYRNLAMRTECEYTDELKERAKENVRALHAGLGLGGELGELLVAVDKGDAVNILEELGDFYWYDAILRNLYNIDSQDFELDKDVLEYLSTNFDMYLQMLQYHIASLLDKIKRAIYYNKPIDLYVMWPEMEGIRVALNCLCYAFGSTPAQVKAANIKKLKARYGDKFSEESATNRDLTQESKILTENLSNG